MRCTIIRGPVTRCSTGLLSVVCSSALSIFSTASYADTAASEKALAQLVRDIQLRAPRLTDKAGASAEGYYTIRPGETLDAIIAKTLSDVPLRKQILRQAVVQANPHAFKRKNPNWMYANKRIKLPDKADIYKVIFTRPSSRLDTLGETRRDRRRHWIHFP